MGNVELFELCETDPETQCKECLLHWNQGAVYCTCGHLLRESEAKRGAIQCTLDLLSIPNYAIKKVRPHGHRHGKIEEQRKHFVAHNIRKRSIKKEFRRNSRSLPERFTISWLETPKWSIWRNMHPDGRRCAERFHLSHVVRWIHEIQKELVHLSQHICTECNDEAPIRLQRSFNKIAPSSPWVWRRATCTNPLLAVSEIASAAFFIQHIMVSVERFLVELKKIIKVKHLWPSEIAAS